MTVPLLGAINSVSAKVVVACAAAVCAAAKASFCRGDVFLAKTFGCLRQGRLCRFDASGCLVARRAGCIDRALAAGARCQQATLALEIALGLGGERLGPPEGFRAPG